MLFRREPRVHSARVAPIRFRLALVAASILASGGMIVRADAVPPPTPQSAPAADAAKARLPLTELQPPIVLPLPAGPSTPLSARAQRAVDRATELRADRRYTEATIELEKALRYDPDHPLVHRAMALTRWEAGEFDRARTELDAALAERPDDMICHYLAGRLAARRFENEAAIQALRTALACPADQATEVFRQLARFHLAELLSTEGYFTAARQAYEQYLAQQEARLDGPASAELAELRRLGPEAAYAGLARASAALGEYALAAEQYRQAHASPAAAMDVEARLELARLLAKAGDLDAAIAETRSVVAEKPEAYALLEELYAAQNRPSEALAELESAVRAHPESAALAGAYFDALHRAGRGDDAATFLRERVKTYPEQGELAARLFASQRERRNWPGAFEALAMALRGRPDLAPDFTRQALELAAEPDAVEGLLGEGAAVANQDFAEAYLRGVLARAAGRSAKAEVWLREALAAAPDFVPARVALGEACLDRYAWDEAIAVAAPEPNKTGSDSRLELILGKAYVGLDESAKAQVHFNAAIRLNRANVEAMFALAELFLEDKEPVRARQQLEALVKADPIHERARELLFRAYLADGDSRAAAEQLEELRRTGASANAVARCVAWLQFDPTAPDHVRLQATLRQAMADNRPDPDTLHLLALSYQLEGHPEKAVEVLEQALVLDPRHTDGAELLALVYQRNLDFEAALRQRELLLARRPNRAEWKLDRLNLLLILQRWEDAAAYARVLLEDPKLKKETKSLLRHELVRTLQLADDLPGAIEILEAWHAEEPEAVEILNWLVASLQEAQRHDEVLGYLRRWTELVPAGFDDGPPELVWRKLPREHGPEVEQLILGWLLADPDDDDRQLALIRFLLATGRHDAALNLARSNESASSGTSSIYFKMAGYEALKAARRPDEAITALTQLTGELASAGMGASVTSIQFQYELAALMIEAGRFDKARERINHWLEAAQTQQEKLTYLRMLTLCEQEAGRLEEAVEALELALEFDPDDIGTHNDLGYTLADLGREVERADELVRYAVANEPRNSAYLDSLGWVKYKEADYAAAAKWLRMARYAGDGEDPTVCDHLGDAYWRLGRMDEARRYWNEAVKFAEERLAEAPQRMLYQQVLEAARAKLAAAEQDSAPKVAEPAQKE